MRKNLVGDFVCGTMGGTLTAYFGIGALLVLLTGNVLFFGPDMPVTATPDSGLLMFVSVRLLQCIYFAGLAIIAFLVFRIMQEILRGHSLKKAVQEALTGPRLW